MGWTEERAYQNPPEIFSAILADIRAARVSVDFETFIFEIDALGESILVSLTEAARRGVKVRLLIDGVGAPAFDDKRIRGLAAQGVRTRVYRPWQGFRARVARALFSGRPWHIFQELGRMNRRNHRKTCVIDREIGWVSSANVSERHREWRETAVRLKGDSVGEITEGFVWIWNHSRDGVAAPPPRPRSSRFVRNNLGFRSRTNRIRRDLMNSAKHSIRIVNPYFVPPVPFLVALFRAVRQGVRLEIMIPQRSDWKAIEWAAKAYYRTLLRRGTRIYEYKDGMIHSKVLLVDDQAIVGSSNFNYRSFLHDLEIDVIVSKPETIQALTEAWESDLGHCRIVTRRDLQRVWWWEKVAQWFVTRFKKLM